MAIITAFRYPGAKNKFLDIITAHIDEAILYSNQNHFCDAFVGGGSVLLNIASRYPNIKLYANDKDYWIYCFWKIVSGSDFNKLQDLLTKLETLPTLELFYKLREDDSIDETHCAYKAIFFNRTTFSGILKAGPIGGKEQKSKYTIDCRYNVKKLQKKILDCHNLLKDRVVVSNCDINKYNILNQTDLPIYLDPPYYIKGESLYSEYMSSEEHKNLANHLNNRKNWVLSYDDCSEVRKLYKDRTTIDLNARYCINGQKTKWENKNELIILP